MIFVFPMEALDTESAILKRTEVLWRTMLEAVASHVCFTCELLRAYRASPSSPVCCVCTSFVVWRRARTSGVGVFHGLYSAWLDGMLQTLVGCIWPEGSRFSEAERHTGCLRIRPMDVGWLWWIGIMKSSPIVSARYQPFLSSWRVLIPFWV